MNPQRVTPWCGFWSGGIIGPYFTENEARLALTVTGARYSDMITHCFLPKLDDTDVANTCIKGGASALHQRDSATFMQNDQVNLDKRVRMSVLSRGGNLPDMLFQK